jgi:glutathione S-transferase
MITITAFKSVPPFAQGLVRDLRARWALEEAGIPYRARLIGRDDATAAAYRALQPFGQVPALEADGQTLFESGAIVLYVAAKSEALLPANQAERDRAIVWLFAALNSIEPAVQNLASIDLFYADEEWAKLRRPQAEAAAVQRLSQLATWIGDKAYLEGRFTAGDLMMATVLRILRHTDLVAAEPTLHAYLKRCEARPAFGRALEAQLMDLGVSAAA